MRRLLVFAGLFAISAAFASQASAGTAAVSVSMSFTEPILQDVKTGCSVIPAGFCGTGVVVPYGKATETIVFGGACGGGCDFRTINVSGGSIYLDEYFSDGNCPGSCQANPAEPGGGNLTDVIAGGTGIFRGASGTLNGSVFAAALQSAIKLSGTITLQT